MNKSYAAIGERFEYLNSDCGYEQWSQYLIETLDSLGAGARGLDIGWGNGRGSRGGATGGGIRRLRQRSLPAKRVCAPNFYWAI